MRGIGRATELVGSSKCGLQQRWPSACPPVWAERWPEVRNPIHVLLLQGTWFRAGTEGAQGLEGVALHEASQSWIPSIPQDPQNQV